MQSNPRYRHLVENELSQDVHAGLHFQFKTRIFSEDKAFDDIVKESYIMSSHLDDKDTLSRAVTQIQCLDKKYLQQALGTG